MVIMPNKKETIVGAPRSLHKAQRLQPSQGGPEDVRHAFGLSAQNYPEGKQVIDNLSLRQDLPF